MSKSAKTSAGSSRRAAPRAKSAKGIGAKSAATDWKRLREQSDDDIRVAIGSDKDAAPELDESFWRTARIVRAQNKVPMTIRLDSDLLAWFQSSGKGYQTQINSVLRAYMKAQQRS